MIGNFAAFSSAGKGESSDKPIVPIYSYQILPVVPIPLPAVLPAIFDPQLSRFRHAADSRKA